MAGLTGITNSKLFKIRTIDLNEPFKVGVNGVTEVLTDDRAIKITYVLDGIKYVSAFFYENTNAEISTGNNVRKTIVSDSFQDLKLNKVGEIINHKKRTNKIDPETFFKKTNKTNQVTKFIPDISKTGAKQILRKAFKAKPTEFPTLYVTEKLSYDSFIEEYIYKNDKYVGLIDKPKVVSDVFMERDASPVFEKHQRLSEINNLSDLISYQNGYFNVVNTF